MKPVKNVVFFDGLAHREVPGYVCLYAGEDGKVRHISPSGKRINPHEKEFRTTKGSYLYVDVISDEFVKVTKAVHQLVCSAWKENPSTPELKYEPNHINGDKHDNRPSNLEWETRSGNVQHAYNSGLCTQGLRIEILDLLTKEVMNFNTLSHCARVLGISRNSLRLIIANHRSDPWQGRYIFKIDEKSDKKVNRHQKKSVKAYDFVNKSMSIHDSFTDASTFTGVNSGTIRWIAVNKRTTIISGYGFKLVGDESPWLEISPEEIENSLSKYPRLNKSTPPSIRGDLFWFPSTEMLSTKSL